MSLSLLRLAPLCLVICFALASCGGTEVCDAGCGGAPVCGDGVCEGGETPADCPADCACTCPDGMACDEADGCVCTDAADGICPAGCPADPDCGSCTPACGGKQCGPDGCGGSCGSCEDGLQCDARGQCAATCVPSCEGRVCGADGCGGSCGTCGDGERCDAGGACVAACTPDCGGRQCGPDGCGGSCGACDGGLLCVADRCEMPDPRCGAIDPALCASLSWGSCADDWAWRTPFSRLGGALHALEPGGAGLWIAGEQGFLAFHDGLQLHKVDNLPGTAQVTDLWRTPGGRLWAVGQGGALFLGDGSCWASIPSPTDADLLGVWGTAENDVWAVGAQGTVLRFDGTRWTRMTIPASVRDGWTGTLRDVWGADGSVWMVGSSSFVVRFDGTNWERHPLVHPSHDLRRVFARGAGDVWILSTVGWWSHWDGSSWQTLGRPDRILDIWGAGQELWRTWAHSGSATAGLERSDDGGASWHDVGGVHAAVYHQRAAFGDELWGLLPVSGGTELLRVANEQRASVGDAALLPLATISGSMRQQDGSLLAFGWDTLHLHGAFGWSTELLPASLHGLYFSWGAALGDELWLANAWRPGGPSLARWVDGTWTRMSLPISQAYGLACTTADCWLAAGSQGLLRRGTGDWSADLLPRTPADGVVVGVAAGADDVWIATNRSGVGALSRRGAEAWLPVATDLPPLRSMGHGDGRVWVLGTGGQLFAVASGAAQQVGAFPATVAGHTLQWQDLLVDGGRVYALADRVVCSTSTERFSFTCYASPFGATFTRLAPAPAGVWALGAGNQFLEVR